MEENRSRIRESVSRCYDEGVCPDDLHLGEVVEDEGGKRFVVNELVNEVKDQWLKERSVIVVFQGEARSLARSVKEDLIRAYEDGWTTRRLFHPDTRRGRVKFEGANVASYVAKAKEIAEWLLQEGELKIKLGSKEYQVLFKPRLSSQELQEARLQEAKTRFWIMALRVPLDAYYYLKSAMRGMFREVVEMHNPEYDKDRPKLMNVKFDMPPKARERIDDDLVIESPKGERWRVDIVSPYTDWCRWYTEGFPLLPSEEVDHSPTPAKILEVTRRLYGTHVPVRLIPHFTMASIMCKTVQGYRKIYFPLLDARIPLESVNLLSQGGIRWFHTDVIRERNAQELELIKILSGISAMGLLKVNEKLLMEENFHSSYLVWAPARGTRGGVAILLHRDLQARVVDSEADLWGRWAWLKVEVANEEWVFMTVYAPNGVGERTRFLARLMQHIPKTENLLLGGDWNLSLDEAMRVDSPQADRSDVQALMGLCTELALVDPFPALNQADPGYTWYSHLHRDGRHIIRRRLDYFLTGEHLQNQVTTVRTVCHPLSDHKPVVADIRLILSATRGRGFFRLNSQVLEEPGVGEWVTKHMESWNRTQSHFETKAQWLDGGLAITSGILDVISRILASERNRKEADCKRRVEEAEVRMEDHPISEVVWATDREKRLNEWDKLQEEKHRRWSEILKVKGIETSDRLTKENFQRLMPRRTQHQMVELKHPFNRSAPTASNVAGMLHYAKLYYMDILTSRSPQQSVNLDLSRVSDMWEDTIVRLQPNARLDLDRPVTIEEVRQTLKSMAKGKSSGADRLTVEFYAANWAAFGPALVDLYNEVLVGGSAVSAEGAEGAGYGSVLQDRLLRVGMMRPQLVPRVARSNAASPSCYSRRKRCSKKVKVLRSDDGGGGAICAGAFQGSTYPRDYLLGKNWVYGCKCNGLFGGGREGLVIGVEKLATESITSRRRRRPKLLAGARADATAADSQQGYGVELQTRQEVAEATVFHMYRRPLLSPGTTATLLHQVQKKVSGEIEAIETEQCFNIAVDEPLDDRAMEKLRWLLRETYEQDMLTDESGLAWPSSGGRASAVVEVGPRLSFTTAWSTNAVSICRACGLSSVTRLERSRRYKLIMTPGSAPPSTEMQIKFASMVHDRMTECIYPSRLTSFVTDVTPAPVVRIPILEEGEAALRAINKKMGLAFDEWDIQYYTKLFRDDIKRNPTNVELFDIAQSNSEHSRHWFFKAQLNIDGEAVPESLMQIVQATLKANPNNSVIGFHDNSRSIGKHTVHSKQEGVSGDVGSSNVDQAEEGETVTRSVGSSDDSQMCMRPQVRLLQSMDMRDGDIKWLISRHPCILQMSEKEIVSRMMFLKVTLGLNRKDVNLVLRRGPAMITESLEELESRVVNMEQLGVEKSDLCRVVVACPSIIGELSCSHVQQRVELLQTLGIKKGTQLLRIITSAPRGFCQPLDSGLYVLVRLLQKAGLQDTEIGNVLLKCPSLLSYRVKETLLPKLRFLNSIGIRPGPQGLGRLLRRFPSALTCSLEEKMRPLARFLLEAVGLREDELGVVLSARPELFRANLNGSLLRTVRFLRKQGFKKMQVAQMVRWFPALLLYQPVMLKSKLEYLRNEMEGSQADLVAFPRFFSYSLEERIVPRHLELRRIGLFPPRSLKWMLACSDDMFMSRVHAAEEERVLCGYGYDKDRAVESYLSAEEVLCLANGRGQPPGQPSPVAPVQRDLDILFTAETHNFPCAVAPFPGAETGAGGRIRDTHATGVGSLIVAGTAGYCVGNLQLDGNTFPWEDQGFVYPPNLASPLQILIDASDGASDYGNKFGEPLIQGYTRTFGMRLPNGERREWLKPIMFSGAIGQIDDNHLEKEQPEIGMLVVKVGGPAYRIGMGGGAASSMVSGDNDAELDFNAVQRGDAEMAQKLYRVVRTCVEMGDKNPIVSIHDQGAGGNCNVVKEIIYPKGAEIDIRSIVVGDDTMSVLEIWGAEYQEQDALLVKPESEELMRRICARERVSMAVIGTISGDGKVVLVDKWAEEEAQDKGLPESLPVVDLDLEKTHLGITGGACAIGEQPLKGLVDPKAMARMGLGEALTNLVWAKVTALRDVKASGNWMYAAKMDGEGAAMYDAAVALRDAMIELEVAIDGGKDSLSMAAQAGGETVKAPGNLVISAYVTCPDITKTVTPDLKLGDAGTILFVDLAQGKRRLGGSALAQVYSQVGNDSPDLEDTGLLRNAFETVQSLIDEGSISAGHDISDGGIAVALLEMAFAGNCGIAVNLPSTTSNPSKNDVLAALFAEELGLVIEVDRSKEDTVLARFNEAGVPCTRIGHVSSHPTISVSIDGVEQIEGKTATLRDIWEETSFSLESLQRAEECVRQERNSLRHRKAPAWELSFAPEWTPTDAMESSKKPKVAVVREEGSNGDREMAAALYMAGLEPWDVMMSDLLSGATSLDSFQGLVFVGGFSYADVLDSAKGWAGTIRFNPSLLEQFQNFYNRKDTFSLGVCNGCQLMALLGWVPGHDLVGLGRDEVQPRFVHNESGRFESRFSTVQIGKSPSIMLQGMEGSTLGIWVAHGEGRALFPDKQVLNRVLESGLAPVRYSDDDGNATEAYPFNPNGSPEGIAALCSADGRHLAIMPHPERCFMMWQFPWSPPSWEGKLQKAGPSPWLRMFQNARKWCEGH
ncbi:hypothetical protein CBR_g19873 [Chara braunii]|uniref:Uncharacterized protein n=1 Tax=Chara braunii TaxID=69332 RepID=A0A388KYU8_CHABU|nr:hypothetical protein CBR_g19873 [Chara braunii]|eukprot:GBG75237.1 hypothetical protein CBR_g19873 [Chara braunii]